MVPPLVTARRWAPGRAVSTSVAVPDEPGAQLGERGRRIAAGEHVEHRERRLGQSAKTAVRRTSAASSSTCHGSIATMAMICWARTSSGLRG